MRVYVALVRFESSVVLISVIGRVFSPSGLSNENLGVGIEYGVCGNRGRGMIVFCDRPLNLPHNTRPTPHKCEVGAAWQKGSIFRPLLHFYYVQLLRNNHVSEPLPCGLRTSLVNASWLLL